MFDIVRTISRIVIPAKAGIQERQAGSRIMSRSKARLQLAKIDYISGMTTVMIEYLLQKTSRSRISSVLRFCAAVGVTLSSYASIEVKNGSFIGCTPSHKNTELHRPQSYPRYNNLTKTISGLPNEYASKIILRGIVVDKHCLPISDAAIKIWQHDEYGDVRYIKDEAFSYKKYDMNYHMYREVNGAGKIYSNNNGQFAFITMPPGRYVNNKDSKYIRISISHMNYLPIDSQIVLTKGDLIDKHSITANFNKADSAFYGVEVYDFKIVISANNKYRKY